jgi:PAS domain S-box-containing protein
VADAEKDKAELPRELAILRQQIAVQRAADLEHLEKVQSYAETIVDTVRQPLVVLDSALRVLTANAAFYETFQVTAEDTERQLVYTLGDGQWDIPALRRLLEEILPQQNVLTDYDVTHEFPHLGRRTMLLNARRLVGGTADAPRILLAIEDITERKRLEEALRNQRDWFDVTLTSIGDAVMATDTRGVITFLNTVAEDLTGWPAQEAIGRPISEVFQIIGEHTRQPAESPVAQALHEGKVVGLANHTLLITRYGTEIPIADSAAPIRGPAGEIRGVVVVFRDGTPYRRLERQLHEAQRMQAIGTFAGGIAHDFNNILTAILGYTEMTQQVMPRGSVAWRNLDQVLMAGRRAASLVQQLLTFGRREAVERHPFRLRLVIHETLGLLRATLPATVEVRVTYNTSSDWVLASPTQLQQMLMNLASNAEYALRATGGLLEVQLDAVEVTPALAARHFTLRPGPHLCLTVRDTGSGMHPEVMERAFEPFFTTKPMGQGTGMGLAIVHGIVTSHQGAIAVTSAPGQGTTFSIYLPRVEEPPPSDEPAAVPAPVSRGQERLLVVDDEEALARLEGEVLTGLGYEVTVCTGSREALETFRATPERFDLVLTDQTMPQMTGDVLARELRRIRPDIPVILCSGYSPVVGAEQARALEIDAFVTKPWVVKTLARVIREVFSQRRAQEA